MVNNLQKKLLEAHVQFELSSLQADNLQQALEQELTAMYHWLHEVKMSEFITTHELIKPFVKLIKGLLSSEEMIVFWEKWRIVLQRTFAEAGTLVEDVFPENLQEWEISEQIIEEQKEKMIAKFVNSSLYSKLLSDVLYSSTKNFLISDEGLFAQKAPGAAKVLRFGQNLLSKKIPKFEESLENTVKEFLQKQIHLSIQQSETFLNKAITLKFLHQIKDTLWQEYSHQPLSELFKDRPLEVVTKRRDIILEWLEHLETTEAFHLLIESWKDLFDQEYHDVSLGGWLELHGCREEDFVQSIASWLFPWIIRARESGYAEKQLRHRLELFYFSDEVKEMLKG